MAKPEWGTKRTCPACGIRFYDLKKTVAICPDCETQVVLQVPKTRKPAPVKEVVAAVIPEKQKTDVVNGEVPSEELEAVVLEVDDDADDDDSLIEDTSDLSEDDGMGEVKEHMKEEISDDH